jgi:hypothetical protein
MIPWRMVRKLDLQEITLVRRRTPSWRQWVWMTRVLNPLQFVLITMAGWMNQRQRQAIEYLREENRVLRE